MSRSSGSGATRGMSVARSSIHGGRPGSPDDSPNGARPRLDDNAADGSRGSPCDTAEPTAIVAAVRPRPCSSTGRRPIDRGRRRSPRRPPATARGWSRSRRASCPTYPDWVWRTTPWADATTWYARWIDQCRRRARARVRRARRRSRREHARVPRDSRERARRRDRLQHDPATSGPTARCSASTASSSATGGERLVWGIGRRLDAHRDRHAVRARRRARSAGRTTCRSRARRCTSRASTCCSRRRGTTPTCGPASMRHIAKEGRCYVLGITSCQRGCRRARRHSGPRRDLRR